jgi:electron transfer flavoprotein alpha subunit
LFGYWLAQTTITRAPPIRLDPNCGWARGKADVLYVADAFAVMEK